VNDKVTHHYDYIGDDGEVTTTSLNHKYYIPPKMILFLNEYLTLKERNKIVHNLPNIYKEKI
tara:strand:- start:236 stop:421 length:186 start_codon:yes stop_codon:yes gene_type:complete